MNPLIVIDTCVLISALRSGNSASYRLLSLIDSQKFTFTLSVPLVLEYEAVAKRMSRSLGLTHTDIVEHDGVPHHNNYGEYIIKPLRPSDRLRRWRDSGGSWRKPLCD